MYFEEPFDFVPQLFYKSTLFDFILSCPLGFRAFSFKKLNKFFFFFYWVLVQAFEAFRLGLSSGPLRGMARPVGAQRVGLELKKTRLVNGTGSGFGGRMAGQVRT